VNTARTQQINVMMTAEAVKVFSGEVEVGDGEPVPVVK
jgi:hypothetical protein